jgi:L-serine dehydratase
MRAAREFAASLSRDGLLGRAAAMRVELYGSLALTGKGHATDRAILLGLSGEAPDTIDLNQIEAKLNQIRGTGTILLLGQQPVAFVEARDLIWHRDLVLPGHPNAMRFTVLDAAGSAIRSEVYFSPGGGFIRREGEAAAAADQRAGVPYPFHSGAEMLEQAQAYSLSVWELMLANEKAWHTEEEIRAYLARIWKVMQESVERGLITEGILPGGLNVRRRAPALTRRLRERGSADPLAVMDWVNVWAMAVNEENAAGGRVVTAPTNGASGLIPAVVYYYERYQQGSAEGVFRFLLTAGAIGVLYKENASISGAEVGCQGEVGVACSMAAAGLTAALEGTNGQVEHSAEIGMEHNLGMTCDPIGGLVQIPCIERNAIGAVKAINASRMAMEETEGHKVQLDQVIRTMYQTGLDMQSRYKETSLAGLAVNAVEC